MGNEKEDFLGRASDPHQYDSPELHWETEGLLDSPVRIYLWERIKSHLGDLSGRSVLDIGTGTAWMPLRMCRELGARDITALEPSRTQREMAAEVNPDQAIVPYSLAEFEADRSFDLITAVMVFEHIEDVGGAFAKLSKLLAPEGRMVVVCADQETFLTPRTDYLVETQYYDEGVVVVKGMRTYGLLYDITRPLNRTIAAARDSGLRLIVNEGLVPDDYLRENVSRYNIWGDNPICHLLIFDKPDTTKH